MSGNINYAQIVGLVVGAPLVSGAALAACVNYGSHYVTALASLSVAGAGIFGIALGVGSLLAMIVGPKFTRNKMDLVIYNLGTSTGLYAIFALASKTGLIASTLTLQGAALLILGGAVINIVSQAGLVALGRFSPI